ncbi:MazG nucleotide pyrophosphohydrolase domain-containing protein [Saccharopolyspora sp. NPDC000995]
MLEQSLKLGEEVGEPFKAIRKTENLPIDCNSITRTVDEELADILIYVCAIANRRNIDLDETRNSATKCGSGRKGRRGSRARSPLCLPWRT